MKRFILCFLLLWTGIQISAQNDVKVPLFCIEPGTHLYYERHKSGSDHLLQTTDMDILSVEQTADGMLVHYSVVLRNKGKREMYGGKAALTTTIDAQGNTYMDFAASVKSFVQGVFPEVNVKTSGTSAILPLDMEAGQVLPDAHAVLELPLFTIRVDVTGRQVLGREQVTTPAGVFDCIVVRDHKVEDVPLNYKDNWVDDWYFPGVGYVQHVVYGKGMIPEAVEQLVRIDRP